MWIDIDNENKKDSYIINGEKALDTLIEYLTENKADFAKAFDLVNEKDDEYIREFFDTQSASFCRFTYFIMSLTAILPDEYIDKFFYEEDGEVLYEE